MLASKDQGGPGPWNGISGRVFCIDMELGHGAGRIEVGRRTVIQVLKSLMREGCNKEGARGQLQKV